MAARKAVMPSRRRAVRSKRSARPSAGPRRPALRIRPAAAGDAATILRMIRGLAEYEHLAREVRATTARIRRDGFGSRRRFRVLIGERGRAAEGFALYFLAYSTFLARPTLFLEDLFVVPEARGRGTGKALLRALAREAFRNGCGRMDWLVLADNAPAIRFYRRLGAKIHGEWVPVRLAGAPLRRLARIRR